MRAKYAAQIRRGVVRAKNEERGEVGRPALSTPLEFDAFYIYGRRSRRCPNCGVVITPGRMLHPHSAIRLRDHVKECLS